MNLLGKHEIFGAIKHEVVHRNKFYDNELNALSFKENKISERLVISFDISTDIVFEACEFENEIKFSGHFTCDTAIKFINCKFKAEVSFYSGRFIKTVEFIDSQFLYSQLNFKGGEFESLRIERSIINNLGFYNGTFTEVIIGAFRIETIINNVFINWSKITGKIDFFRAFIYELDIRGILHYDSFISISECFIQHFIFKEFSNNGRLRINKPLFNSDIGSMNPNIAKGLLAFDKEIINELAEKKPVFLITESLLGKAELFSIDFTNYSIVCINESSLIEIIISNVRWPKKIYHIPIGKRGNNKTINETLVFETKINMAEYRLQRENYRQIKFACSKQGDYIGEQHFHALEMAVYNNSLSHRDHFWTKLTLSLSSLTSNYGQSLLLPLFWLLFGHLILFIICLFFNGFYPLHLSFSNPTKEAFEIAFEKYFIYINPLRRSELSLGGYLIIIDVSMRIWASYMIYNFARASRRFIK